MTGTLDSRFQRVSGSNVCIIHLFFLLQVPDVVPSKHDSINEEAVPLQLKCAVAHRISQDEANRR
jgi:hypothetical protein